LAAIAVFETDITSQRVGQLPTVQPACDQSLRAVCVKIKKT
jgi:hypothetical protein